MDGLLFSFVIYSGTCEEGTIPKLQHLLEDIGTSEIGDEEEEIDWTEELPLDIDVGSAVREQVRSKNTGCFKTMPPPIPDPSGFFFLASSYPRGKTVNFLSKFVSQIFSRKQIVWTVDVANVAEFGMQLYLPLNTRIITGPKLHKYLASRGLK